jgi:hypothetical protein
MLTESAVEAQGIDDFFRRPILNSPYESPRRHWVLDEQGQPTQRVIENRRVGLTASGCCSVSGAGHADARVT